MQYTEKYEYELLMYVADANTMIMKKFKSIVYF